MTFFNKQEEVMEIKLTQFGKYQLSRGSFEPIFYRFFDDDIIYDTEHINTTEEQNDSEPRIKETIRLRGQTIIDPVGKTFYNETLSISREERGVFMPLSIVQDPVSRDKILKYPISNMSYNKIDLPYIYANFPGSKIKNKGSLEYDKVGRIPQINIEKTFAIHRRQTFNAPGERLFDSETYIALNKDEILFNDGTELILIPSSFNK